MLRLDRAVHRAVGGGQDVVGGALEHRQRLGLARDDRDRLHTAGACADHGNALAGEIHAPMRPEAGVVGVALEIVQAREIRHARDGEISRRHNADGGLEGLARLGF